MDININENIELEEDDREQEILDNDDFFIYKTHNQEIIETFIQNTKVIQKNIISFKTWEGYVTNIDKDYFEGIFHTITEQEETNVLRIKKELVNEVESIEYNRKVIFTQKKVRDKKNNKINIINEVRIERPIKYENEAIEELVKEKLKKYSFLFDEK